MDYDTLAISKVKSEMQVLSKIEIVFAPFDQRIINTNEEKEMLLSGNLVTVCPNVVEKHGAERIPYIKVILQGIQSFFVPLGYLNLNEKQKDYLIKATGGYIHNDDFRKSIPIQFCENALLN